MTSRRMRETFNDISAKKEGADKHDLWMSTDHGEGGQYHQRW